MAFEFDNEMDFLLRQTARSNDLAPETAVAGEHLDPDDLTAFAENALPDKARSRFVAHLSDCNSCREILADLILLNESAQQLEEATNQPHQKDVAAKASWINSFKKLFAVPTLGYVTAGLAVLLIGSFAFVALRQTEQNREATVAQIAAEETQETQEGKKRAAAPAPAVKEGNEPRSEEIPVETLNSNAEIPVETTPTPGETSVDNLPPSVRATKGENAGERSAASLDTTVAARNNSANVNSVSSGLAPRQTTPGSVFAETPEKQKTTESETAPAAAPKPEDKAKNELRAQSRDENYESAPVNDNDDLSKTAARSGAAVTPAAKRRAAASETVSGRTADKKDLNVVRTIGNKTFQKVGNLWKDSAFGSQNAQNVARGSGEYKKLDAGLRSIAEQLGGEILVLWQGSAYRIR